MINGGIAIIKSKALSPINSVRLHAQTSFLETAMYKYLDRLIEKYAGYVKKEIQAYNSLQHLQQLHSPSLQ